ncbi:hypothetical protein BHE74_00056420 [Ensete ventricosum]|nr:hypothetical protein BHE74_00056420 [Ensete ventricosum]
MSYWLCFTKKFKLRSNFGAPSQNFKILAIPNVLDHGKSYEHGFAKKQDGHNFVQSRVFQFRSDFGAPSQNFKTLAIPNVLNHGKSYEHGFTKKLDGHKLCAKSRVELSFDRFFVYHLGISKYWPFPTSYEYGFVKNLTIIKLRNVSRRVEFRSDFGVPSPNFKITTIPNVLAHGKSYEHDFTKKCDGHKLYAKSRAESSFDRFFVYHLRILKYWPFPTYLPMVVRARFYEKI